MRYLLDTHTLVWALASPERLGAESLSVTDEHALIAVGLDWNHRDSFDRMLAAQAIAESATLITTDDAFRELGGIRLLW